MRLYTRAKRRLAANRLAGQMTNKYQRKQATRTAGQLGNGLSMIDGQLYNTGATNGHGTVAVVNLGRPAAAIYAPQTGGQIVLGGGSGGGCSDGGSGGIGIHALDGPYHTGTLAQSQAPWAALDSDLQDHISDPIHHDRLHSIISTDDHEVTAARYAVLGTPNAANALAMWATSSNGTAGNALLRSDSNGAIYLRDLYAYDKVQSQSYTPGFAGSGYRLDYGVTNTAKSFLEVDDLSVRRRMTVRELLIRKIRTTNGDIFVTSGGEVETATDLGGGSWRLTFKEDHGFLEDDLIAAQAWTGSGVYRLEATVTAYTSTKQIDIRLDDGGGDTPGTILAAGLSLSFARHGSTSDADRQGVVYLSSDDTGAPFIRVLDGIDSWAAWTDPASLKVQMGRLDGISHAILGDLAGYGLFGEAVYLTGTLTAGNGDAVMGDQGLNIQAGTISNGGWTNASDKITFATDPMATLDETNTVGQIGAVQFVSGSDVIRRLAARVQAGAAEGADEAVIELLTQYVDPEADVPIQYAGITMGANNGSPYITIGLQGDSAAAGNVYITSPVTDFSGHIRMSGGGDIGTAIAPVGTLYANDLVILNQVNFDNPGYVNDTRYMPRSELTTTLAAYAPVIHNHAGLVTSGDLTDALADYATSADLAAAISAIPAPDLSNYWTKAQADGRYAQATEFDAHVGAVNPHGTGLADLITRPYAALTGRTHVLATNTGLGDDHSISGATVGHVLRATSAATARFMQPLYADLGSRQHDLIGSDHSIVADQYGVIGTPVAENTLGIWYPTDDGTAGHQLLKSGASGQLTVNDLTAQDIVGASLEVTGSIASSDYTADSHGFYIDGDYAEFNKLTARGALTAAVFEIDSTAVFANRQLIAKAAGTLRLNLEIDTSILTAYDIHVDDPKIGHHPVFARGDRLLIRGLGRYTTATTTNNSVYPAWDFWNPSVLPSGLKFGLAWFVVDDIVDNGTHYTYECTWYSGDTKITFLAGEAIADYGQSGDGVITSVATGPGAPFIDVRTHFGSPWEDEAVRVRIGQIGGIVAVRESDNEWGFVAGNLTAAGRYIALTDHQTKIKAVPFEMTDSTGNVTGLWDDDGIFMIAPVSAAYQQPGDDQAVGGGAPDEDWYAPAYSAISWASVPNSTDPNDEYGALRMMTRRTTSQGFGEEGYDTITRMALTTRGQQLMSTDNIITESVLSAMSGIDNVGEFVIRAYAYARSTGTEAELTADFMDIYVPRVTFHGEITTTGIRLTNYPTSEDQVGIGEVYVDAGTLKVKIA